MNDSATETPAGDGGLVLEYDLDAPPSKVWRAISIPEFREQWWPDGAQADPEPLSSSGGEEIRYRVRDREPPFLESIVTFRIRPNESGGCTLRIVHAPPRACLASIAPAANDDVPVLMRAA
ncbi:SRPBCC family protein [Pseudoxanthomonas beigongshangi]